MYTENQEGLQVLKYVDGQKYEPHFGTWLLCRVFDTYASCQYGGGVATYRWSHTVPSLTNAEGLASQHHLSLSLCI
jgi:hypothetical protein